MRILVRIATRSITGFVWSITNKGFGPWWSDSPANSLSNKDPAHLKVDTEPHKKLDFGAWSLDGEDVPIGHGISEIHSGPVSVPLINPSAAWKLSCSWCRAPQGLMESPFWMTGRKCVCMCIYIYMLLLLWLWLLLLLLLLLLSLL